MISMPVSRSFSLALATAALVAAPATLAAGGTAKGTLAYKAKSGPIAVSPKYAYLVKGPDAVEPGKVMRKLIFSTTDIGAKIDACKTMSCTNADLGEGMTVELDAGPRVNYWVVLNGQRVQYSGTEPAASLKLTTSTPQRLAGTLAFDGAAAGGAQVAIEFDTPLVKEMAKAR
jgi:hypothetical protein